MADPKFELRTHAYVSRLIYDKAAKKVRGVVYIDRNTGEEIEQPADMVVLAAYTFNNVGLLLRRRHRRALRSATGKGVVGKNYCYQVNSNLPIFVEDGDQPVHRDRRHPGGDRRFPGRQFRS